MIWEKALICDVMKGLLNPGEWERDECECECDGFISECECDGFISD